MPERAFVFLLCVLAVYRLAAMVTLETGPLEVFYRWRAMWGRAAAARRNIAIVTIAELFSCPYCLGVWLALGLALWLFRNEPPHLVLWWLAIAGGQAFLQGLERGKYD